MGNFTYAVFFISVRGGVFPSKTDRKDGNCMEESYKEMYVYLYKHMEILQCLLNRLSVRIEDSLVESTGIYIEQLDEQIKDREDVRKQFADLLKDI